MENTILYSFVGRDRDGQMVPHRFSALQDVLLEPDRAAILVPVSMRYLPLMVWCFQNEVRVISDGDKIEGGEMAFYRGRDPEWDKNLSVVTGFRLEYSADGVQEPESFGNRAGGIDWVGERVPVMSGESRSERKVHGLRVYYDIQHVDSTETIVLDPDFLLFEHEDGEYSALADRQGNLVTADVLEQAVRWFVGMQVATLHAYSYENFDDSEIWEDVRSTELLVSAAMAADDYRRATVLAARFFQIPTGGLESRLTQMWR